MNLFDSVKGLVLQKLLGDREQVMLTMVRGNQGMLRELKRAQIEDALIGIVTPVLGNGIALSKIVEVTEDDDPTVTVKVFNVHGEFMPDKNLPLKSLKGVSPFTRAEA